MCDIGRKTVAALAALRRNVSCWGMSGRTRSSRPLRILTLTSPKPGRHPLRSEPLGLNRAGNTQFSTGMVTLM